MNLLYIPIQKPAYILLLAALLSASPHGQADNFRKKSINSPQQEAASPYGRADDFRFIIDGLPDGWEGQAVSNECEKGDDSYGMLFCRGMGYVYLSKGGRKLSFESDDMIFSAENGRIGAAVSPVFFADFNYDGLPDIAIRNGNNGNYHASSFDIYTATPDSDFQYTLNKELTDLAQSYSGLPELEDPENKILRTYAKINCCKQYTYDFKVMPDGTLQKVRILYFYADLQTDDIMRVESRWIDGKWHTGEPRPFVPGEDW